MLLAIDSLGPFTQYELHGWRKSDRALVDVLTDRLEDARLPRDGIAGARASVDRRDPEGEQVSQEPLSGLNPSVARRAACTGPELSS